jgi:hypothetical protein
MRTSARWVSILTRGEGTQWPDDREDPLLAMIGAGTNGAANVVGDGGERAGPVWLG